MHCRSLVMVWALTLTLMINAVAAPARACPSAIAGTGVDGSPRDSRPASFVVRDDGPKPCSDTPRLGERCTVPTVVILHVERWRGSEDDGGLGVGSASDRCGMGGSESRLAVRGPQSETAPDEMRAGTNVQVRGP